MSTLTITNNFTNSTTADAPQVNTNFTDVKSFVDSHLLHKDAGSLSDGAWIADAALIAKFFGTANQGMKMVWGKTAYSIVSANGVAVTVTYGVTFSVIPFVLLTVKSDSNTGLIAFLNGAPTATAAGCFVQARDASTTLTQSGDLHWAAIGPP